MTPRMIPLAAVLLLAGAATAQHHPDQHPDQHPGQHPSGPAQPYAGMQDRAIKALSAREMEDLRAGRGMGLALAAELNGYPGPLHVLELAEALALTPAQRERMEALMAAMRAETRPLGVAVITAEAALERVFASGQAEAATVTSATEAAGAARAALRAAHLRAHLATREALSADQRRRYAELRGYAARD
jgi:Spy/CpxP family protein refolding chaperone